MSERKEYIGTVYAKKLKENPDGSYELPLNHKWGYGFNGEVGHIDVNSEGISWTYLVRKGKDTFTLTKDGSLTYHGVSTDIPNDECTEKYTGIETIPFFDMVEEALIELKKGEDVDLCLERDYADSLRGAYYTAVPELFPV